MGNKMRDSKIIPSFHSTSRLWICAICGLSGGSSIDIVRILVSWW